MESAANKPVIINVCTGAGCKAWEAESICHRFSAMVGEASRIRVCKVKCMRQCGGGASIRAGGRRSVIKLRHPEEAGAFLMSAGANQAA